MFDELAFFLSLLMQWAVVVGFIVMGLSAYQRKNVEGIMYDEEEKLARSIVWAVLISSIFWVILH